MTNPYRPRDFLPGIYGADVPVTPQPQVVSPLATPGNGPIAGYTNVFDFNLVNFDWITWHEYEWQNWVQVDALLNTAIGFLQIRGIWRPLTVYSLGDMVYDPDNTANAWRCLVPHTSSTDFVADQALGYWEAVTKIGPPVSSVFGRLGNVLATAGDYDAFYYTKAQVYTKTEVNASQAAQDALIAANASAITAANGNANNRVLKAGDTMTGPLVLPAAAPTLGTHATHKTYVDGQTALRMRWAGVWGPGTYVRNDVVLDGGKNGIGGYLFVCVAASTTQKPDNGNKPPNPTDWATLTGGTESGSAVTVSPTPPAVPRLGEMWFSTAEPVGLFIWMDDGDSTQWVQTNGGVGGVACLPLTGGTLTGDVTIESVLPSSSLRETDAAALTGWYRHTVSGGNFYVQRSATAYPTWTGESIWRYLASSDIVTHYKSNYFASTAPVEFGAPVTFDALPCLSMSYPALWFHDTSPAGGGAPADLGLSGGNGWFRFYSADAAGTSLVDFFTINPLTSVISYLPIRIITPTPVLEFDEDDKTSPAGHYRFILDTGNFQLHSALTANFATYDQVFSHKSPSDGGTDTFNIFKPVSIGAQFAGTNANLKLESTYPGIWFADNTPSGGYPNLCITGGNSNFRFGEADANGVLGATFFWASPLVVQTEPITKLAATGNIVEIGSASGSQINFKRSTSVNYITVPDATTFRITNVSAVAWASINSASGWAAGTSDIRLKENVADIHYGLDTIMALRPVQFDWIAEKRHDIGFIAQDVEHIIPEIVEVWEADPDIEGQIDTYAMRKDAITAVLVKAVQELTARVQELEARL